MPAVRLSGGYPRAMIAWTLVKPTASCPAWIACTAADGDYHIQISPTHDDDQGTDFLIVEVPTPAPEFVADTSLHPRLEAVRTLIRGRMLRGREPSRSGSMLTHPACVEVAGQLFYDDP